MRFGGRSDGASLVLRCSVWCLAMVSILGKPGGPGQFPTHDLSTVRGALQPTGNSPPKMLVSNLSTYTLQSD
jgi:hypothetical protein